MAKLTRSRRPAADARAARNTPLTAAKVAAPDGVRMRAAAFADREGEVAALWTLTLDSASAPRRSRRQPARPRSSRVGSRAMATAAAKPVVGKRGRGVAAGAQAGELKVNAAVALKITPLPGPGFNPRAGLLVAGIVVRLALTPVGKAGSITRHAAAPTLGRAEPRLVLVEPEPQAIRRSELCRHEVILLRRADAGRRAPVLLAQHSASRQCRGSLTRVARVPDRGGRGDRNPRNCVPAETAATPPPICAFRNHRVLMRAGGSTEHGVLSEALDSRRAQCARGRGARQCWHTCARPARAA
eukprot:scaffold5836_cov68-Phaeocystis_antarctica.AAC.1